jgi:uncharacterized membrane protein YkvA (DUF1232 family)
MEVVAMDDQTEGSLQDRAPAREQRFYHRLRRRLQRMTERAHIPPEKARYLLLAPDLFVLLARLARDPRVPGWVKRRLVACLVYFLSPVDLIPDFLPLGFLDDVIVAAVTIHTVAIGVNAVDPSVLEEHWEGEEEILPLLQEISAKTEAILGKSFRFVATAVRAMRKSILDPRDRFNGRTNGPRTRCR